MGRFCLQSQTLALPVHARSWSPLPILSCARVTPAPGENERAQPIATENHDHIVEHGQDDIVLR
jgi:hypothetical protein